MNRSRFFPALTLLLVSFLGLSARAAETEATWKVDDVINLERLGDFQLSPDATRVVWVKSVPNKDKDQLVSQLFLTDLSTTNEVQLTRGKESCHSPIWSPDGRRLAFSSGRPDPEQKEASENKDEGSKDQIWLLDLAGGEPERLTKGSRGVNHFQWRDVETILFTAQEEVTQRESGLKEKKDKSIVTEDDTNEPPVRLFSLKVPDKKVTRLTDNADRISTFAISPDGAKAITLHARSLRFMYDQRIRPTLWLHDLSSGQARQLLGNNPPAVANLVWTPDSRGIYVTIARGTHPIYRAAYVLEPGLLKIDTGDWQAIPFDWRRGLATGSPSADSDPDWFGATPDGLIALLIDGVHNRLARFTYNDGKWQQTMMTGAHATNIHAFRLSTNSARIVYQYSSATQAPQLFVNTVSGAALGTPRALTRLNAALTNKPTTKVEIVRWPGANGVQIEGLLYYPRDYRAGQSAPLVVMIHGGPHALDQDAWDHNWAYAPNLYTSRGAFAFQPNYQGSFGYGLDFSESIANGKYYDLPVEDIIKGIDYLVARGLVDPERVGTLGWSNGAILTMALITRDQRFKAAAAGAGGVEWTADTAACAFGLSFNDYYFGKTPWQDPELYRRLSPFWQMDRITTPVLLFQGSEDVAVPPHHGWMQFRVLQEYGKAPVRYIQFPGEPHGLRRLSSQRRKLDEELVWFDRYLFHTNKDDAPMIKERSPLALALKLHDAARDHQRYGRLVQGQLIPETVSCKGHTIGRFEITQAQFAEFDKNYRVEPGRENFPANGVTFEQAKEYCEWLSKLTSETCRLPNAKEADEFYAPAEEEAQENTLDRWAGYAVNPEDAQRLRQVVEKLGGGAALLREVGSFGGRGEDYPVFDLGGNVAEWTTDKNGAAVARGGSADAPADAKAADNAASVACRGFRVVREVGSDKKQ